MMRNRASTTRKKLRRPEAQNTDDNSTDVSDGRVGSATRLTAALTAFEHMVAEIEGAEVRGQALLVDGRVLIDLAESSEQVIDLVAADDNNDRKRSSAS